VSYLFKINIEYIVEFLIGLFASKLSKNS